MFKEIENDILSIINNDPVDKIIRRPSKDVAKSMDILFDIKFENIVKVYTNETSNTLIVIHNLDKEIEGDSIIINGKVYELILVSSKDLVTDENNAIVLTRTITTIIIVKLANIIEKYHREKTTLGKVLIVAQPVIMCSIMRRIYNGPSLAKVIYMTLIEKIPHYKYCISETGIESILNLLDEGLTINELLDNGFICAIKPDDTMYPGIWVGYTKTEDNEEENKE